MHSVSFDFELQDKQDQDFLNMLQSDPVITNRAILPRINPSVETDLRSWHLRGVRHVTLW